MLKCPITINTLTLVYCIIKLDQCVNKSIIGCCEIVIRLAMVNMRKKPDGVNESLITVEAIINIIYRSEKIEAGHNVKEFCSHS